MGMWEDNTCKDKQYKTVTSVIDETGGDSLKGGKKNEDRALLQLEAS
jgi:hypothetical protein